MRIIKHLDFFRSKGGGGQSDVFFKSATYQPTLSKFRGGPVKKKHPVCYYLGSHTQPKKSQTADRKVGGVNAYGQPGRKIFLFLRHPLG